MLYLSYANPTVSKYEQQLLYDLNNIIAAVGGSMGLFLGFSFFTCGKEIIEAIFEKKF